MSVVATHRYTCLCGEKSPRFTSRKSARDWHASHVQAGGPVRRAKPRHELNCEDFDQLTAHARKFRPIEPSMNGSAFVVSEARRRRPLGKVSRRRCPLDGNQLPPRLDREPARSGQPRSGARPHAAVHELRGLAQRLLRPAARADRLPARGGGGARLPGHPERRAGAGSP
jgi:hypothetical protein